MKFLKTSKGAALVEYGMLVGLIAVLAIVSVSTLGGTVRDVFGATQEALTENNPLFVEIPEQNEGSLVLDNSALSLGVIGQAYSEDISARLSGETDAVVWSLSNAPGWLSLNGTSLEGTPPSAGDFTFDVTVVEGEVEITRSFNLGVQDVIPDVVMTFTIAGGTSPGQTGFGVNWSLGSVSYSLASPDIELVAFRNRHTHNETYFTAVSKGSSFPYGLNANDYKMVLTLDCGGFGVWDLSSVSHSSSVNASATSVMEFLWSGGSRPIPQSGQSYTCTLRK